MGRIKLSRQSKIDYIKNNKEHYQGTTSLTNIEELNDIELQKLYLKVQGSVRRASEKNPYGDYYTIQPKEVASTNPLLSLLEKTKKNMDINKLSQIPLTVEEWISAMSMLNDIKGKIEEIETLLYNKGKDKLPLIESYIKMTSV